MPLDLLTHRCITCDGHPLLGTHDDLLREDTSAISISHIGDLQWILASIPLREFELGIRRVSSLALSAFLTFAASTTELQTLIIWNESSSVDYAVHEARARWCSFNNTSCPINEFRSVTVMGCPGIARD